MIVHLQSIVVDETGITLNFVGGRDFVDTFQHEADETVALAFNTVHDFTAVNGSFSSGIHAKTRCPLDLMHRLGGGNQQF
ncbi:hypothetical protein D3C72_2230200 [compost metagenome]